MVMHFMNFMAYINIPHHFNLFALCFFSSGIIFSAHQLPISLENIKLIKNGCLFIHFKIFDKFGYVHMNKGKSQLAGMIPFIT